MAYDPIAVTNRDWAKIHLNFGIFAIPCLIVLLLSRTGVIDDGYGAVGVSFTALSILVMFLSRKSDEYTLSLWSAGANAGFMATVAWLLFAPFLEGFIDGLLARAKGMDWPAEMGIYVAIATFLITFNWRRLRGAM